MDWKRSITMTQRRGIEQNHGVRYTELLRLPYFDSPRFIVVDAMHNILLGSAKLLTTIWKDNGVLPVSKFNVIQGSVDKFVTPADIGRIPHKIIKF